MVINAESKYLGNPEPKKIFQPLPEITSAKELKEDLNMISNSLKQPEKKNPSKPEGSEVI